MGTGNFSDVSNVTRRRQGAQIRRLNRELAASHLGWRASRTCPTKSRQAPGCMAIPSGAPAAARKQMNDSAGSSRNCPLTSMRGVGSSADIPLKISIIAAIQSFFSQSLVYGAGAIKAPIRTSAASPCRERAPISLAATVAATTSANRLMRAVASVTASSAPRSRSGDQTRYARTSGSIAESAEPSIVSLHKQRISRRTDLFIRSIFFLRDTGEECIGPALCKPYQRAAYSRSSALDCTRARLTPIARAMVLSSFSL